MHERLVNDLRSKAKLLETDSDRTEESEDLAALIKNAASVIEELNLKYRKTLHRLLKQANDRRDIAADTTNFEESETETDTMNNNDGTFNAMYELLKMILKPGYLYGIGEDGEVYCVETRVPINASTRNITFQTADTAA